MNSTLRILCFLLLSLGSCSPAKKNYNPHKKFSVSQLLQDYDLYRNILQERHPSLYWYTPKSSMDAVFEEGRAQITDSLTEYDFRKLVSRVTTFIQCGHTLVRPSRNYVKYVDTVRGKTSFPLFLKTWNDTVAVVHNLHVNDSVLTRGVIIDSIEGIPVKELLDTMYRYVIADGNNIVAKNQVLSTGTYFGALFTALYGWKNPYHIVYRDSNGLQQNALIKPFRQAPDSLLRNRKKSPAKRRISRKHQLLEARSLTIDSTRTTAIMELNSFSEKLRLRNFFHESFRELHQKGITRLIIDLRVNGGGRVSYSNLLTRYLAQKPFKVGDSLYAKTLHTRYGSYIRTDFWARAFMRWVTHKKTDGNYHFGYYERHRFKPKKRNHFSGTVYLLSGGNSFSATTLVMNVLKPQPNIFLLGEPTGGAAYGNSAWLIPEVTLPNTKIRFRLPLFRLVINKDVPKDGKGIQPEVWVGPTTEAIRKGKDFKMDAARALLSAP